MTRCEEALTEGNFVCNMIGFANMTLFTQTPVIGDIVVSTTWDTSSTSIGLIT
jgi:hypothetical protein